MMAESVHDLIEEVRKTGADVFMDAGRLKVSRVEVLSDGLVARIKANVSAISDHLGATEILPYDRTHGEILDSVLYKAQDFHDRVLSRPPAWDNPQLLHIQSRSADATLSTASRLQAANLAAKSDPNRQPSQKLLEAVARAEEAVRLVDEQRASRDAAARSAPGDAA
jgi:hypothetical protein